MTLISLLVLLLVGLALCYYGFAAYCVRSFFREKGRRQRNSAAVLPPVSIIKPVTRAEVGVFENFASFCRQHYADYEIIFAMSGGDEAVAALIDRLRKEFPHLRIDLVQLNQNNGPNYKVGNLMGAIAEARHDLLVISDSDMRVGPGYLQEVIGTYRDRRAGLVTCLYRGVNIRNIAAAFQALFIQADFIPNVLLDNRLEGISYSFGATICLSKEVLAAIGGLEPLLHYLADDYQMGYRVHKKGYPVVICPYLVDHVSGMKTFKDFFWHQLRWAVTQRVSRPLGYTASVVTHGVTLAALFLVLQGFSALAWAVFLLVLGTRLAVFALLNREVIRNREVQRYLWLLPFRDLLHSVIWLLSLVTDTVKWGDRQFRVARDGRMSEH